MAKNQNPQANKSAISNKMLQYHVLALLSLAVAAITGIEAAAQWMHPTKGFANPLGWLMFLLCIVSIVLYFRTRKFRKKAGGY